VKSFRLRTDVLEGRNLGRRTANGCYSPLDSGGFRMLNNSLPRVIREMAPRTSGRGFNTQEVLEEVALLSTRNEKVPILVADRFEYLVNLR
jgi:hypothetical protein